MAVKEWDGTEWVVRAGGGGGSFDGEHNDLAGRDVLPAHPASAVSGGWGSPAALALDELAVFVELSYPVDLSLSVDGGPVFTEVAPDAESSFGVFAALVGEAGAIVDGDYLLSPTLGSASSLHVVADDGVAEPIEFHADGMDLLPPNVQDAIEALRVENYGQAGAISDLNGVPVITPFVYNGSHYGIPSGGRSATHGTHVFLGGPDPTVTPWYPESDYPPDPVWTDHMHKGDLWVDPDTGAMSVWWSDDPDPLAWVPIGGSGGGGDIGGWEEITQANYDLLTPPDTDTVYFIVG